MRTIANQLMTLFFLGLGTIFAQDIPQSQVPSVIVNNFKAEFPKASDLEWEHKGNQYIVDFEIGWFTDYKAWFTTSGKLIKYSVEISKRHLPKAITNVIKKQYKGYRIDDVKKIIENGVEFFEVEIEKGNDELELTYSKHGKLI